MNCPCSAQNLGTLNAPRGWTETHAVVPAWQVDPAALRALVAHARQAAPGLGALGSATGAAGGAASGASAGATVAGPWGAAVGAVVGAALSFLHKNYYNLAQANATCAQLMELWRNYLQIQGSVAGRAIGWPAMQGLMHAGVGAGLFPGNDQHMTWHEGTSQCAGNGTWVDEMLCNGKVPYQGCKNCICQALAHYQQVMSQKPANVPDAVYFVDDVWMPLWESTSGGNPWGPNGVASSPQAHQLMYDLADAYLAANLPGSVPYVAHPVSAAEQGALASALQQTAPGAVAAVASASTGAAAQAPVAQAPVTAPAAVPVTAAGATAAGPAIGSVVTTLPEPGTSTLLQLPAGTWQYQGTDTAGSWIVSDSSGALWHLVSGSLEPYSAAAAAAPAGAYSYAQTPGYGYAQPAAGAAAPAGAVAAAAPVAPGSLVSGNTGLLILAAAAAAIFLL